MSEREPDGENTPWTHQPYGGSSDQPSQPQPPAYPTNPYADPGHRGDQGADQGGQPQWGQQQAPGQPYGQPYSQQGYGQQGYPQPGYAQGYPQQFPVAPNHPQANTALILGIVALGGGFVCGLPILAGPFAWIMGAKVAREVEASQGQLGGRSEAKAGMILGIIATVLLVLAIVAVVAVIAIAAASSSSY